jgi:excinuclease UvrABC helicase subunit UvrB
MASEMKHIENLRNVLVSAVSLNVSIEFKHMDSSTAEEIDQLKREMLESASKLDFEKATVLRDQIKQLEALLLIYKIYNTL